MEKPGRGRLGDSRNGAVGRMGQPTCCEWAHFHAGISAS